MNDGLKVRMGDNLIHLYQTCPEFDYRDSPSTSSNELMAVKRLFGWGEYFKVKEFLKSIEGRVIELTFIHGDAFEVNDNNYWLPESLWYTLGEN